jgi:hypothetical protein
VKRIVHFSALSAFTFLSEVDLTNFLTMREQRNCVAAVRIAKIIKVLFSYNYTDSLAERKCENHQRFHRN